MAGHNSQRATGYSGKLVDHDVIVIGAGFAGIYAVYRFNEQGLNVLCLEAGAEVGGVWWHNRYPGAQVDVESTDYCYYSFPELYREWKWSKRYSPQPELWRYINHVAERLDLKKYIRFNSRVVSAERRDKNNLWVVTTANGERYTCRFLVTAMGNLSEPVKPQFEGLEDFEGRWIQTSRWPDEEIDFEGKRVGVIGTGASGVQCIAALAGVASKLTVFQRSPNFCMPSQNRHLDPREIEAIADRFDDYRESLFESPGLTHFPASLDFFALTDEERRETLEWCWQEGGHVITQIFQGTQTNRTVNDYIADFIREKIRDIVKNPAIAETLCPYDHEFGLRRLPVADGYYESYNREDVELVNVRKDPIKRFTRTGIELESGAHHELDIVLLAIGFHSFTGALLEANIRNDKGVALASNWRPGWQTFLGVMSAGYPNLFMICGPGGVTISANVPPSSEWHVDWIGDLIGYMDKNGYSTVDVDKQAQDAWVDHVAEISKPLFVMKDDRPNRIIQFDPNTGRRVCMTYLGGFQRYREQFARVRANGYEGFVFDDQSSGEHFQTGIYQSNRSEAISN